VSSNEGERTNGNLGLEGSSIARVQITSSIREVGSASRSSKVYALARGGEWVEKEARGKGRQRKGREVGKGRERERLTPPS